jgi:2-keto-3-deoxy-L-rhamnonate aldolase RhmA
MKVNRTRRLLREGRATAGSWMMLCGSTAADLMGLAGFDWLVIDMEHGTGDYQTLLGQVQAINSVGDTTPIVRVQANDPNIVKRVLEAGAEGVMVPGIRTVEEARLAVASTRYPPEGIRSVSFPRASRYGLDPDYLREANDNVALFLQFETRDAVENAEAILELPGIDVAFVGPNDLAADLGHTGQLDHPEVRAAIGRVEEAANRRGVALGSVSRTWEEAEALLARGYRAAALMSDVAFLLGSARTGAERMRAHRLFGDR